MSTMRDHIDHALNQEDTSVIELEDEAGPDTTRAAVIVYHHGEDSLMVRFGRGYAGLHAEVTAFVDGERAGVETIPSIDGCIVQADRS